MPGALAVVLLVLVSLLSVNGASIPTDDYTHDAYLDEFEKFHLYWKFDDKTITFEVHAETLGYVGFGISPNGGMTNADIVIGWVKDGEVFFKDRFATKNGEPDIDESQDYELLGGMETETHTILKFTRKLETCDDKDRTVAGGTLRLIYSYHKDDPESETGLSYHGSDQRGSRSIHLLGYTPDLPDMPTGDDLLTFDFLNQNVTVPHHKDTTYWCMLFKLPKLDKKHHMIKYEPIIQEGNEALVHHILMYQCFHSIDEKYDRSGHECYQPNMPANMTLCTTIIISWAIGGGAFHLPEEAGFSLGDLENGDPDFVVMEIHYDNPEFKDTFVDSSGIRIYYTPILRQNDASILEIGNTAIPRHLIPPYASNFLTPGFCSEECLSEVSNSSGITVFASLLHSHLGGISLRSRHFRQGVEKKVIAVDNSYDFNFQEMRHLEEPIHITPGDNLVLECTYNTESRTGMTYGGLSTREEMCLNYLYYYPRIPLTRCDSAIVLNEALYNLCGITRISYRKYPPVVVQPEEYAGQSVFAVLESLDWNQEQIDTLEDSYQQTYFATCQGENKMYDTNGKKFAVPEITEPLPQEEDTCAMVGRAVSQYSNGITVTMAMLTAFAVASLP
ncbi:DBH-like monooxygenase protein 1 homolog [Glandiceps talaboti]